MEKSEATTQALEDGKIRYYISWSTNVTVDHTPTIYREYEIANGPGES